MPVWLLTPVPMRKKNPPRYSLKHKLRQARSFVRLPNALPPLVRM